MADQGELRRHLAERLVELGDGDLDGVVADLLGLSLRYNAEHRYEARAYVNALAAWMLGEGVRRDEVYAAAFGDGHP